MGDTLWTSVDLRGERHDNLEIAWAILLWCYTEEIQPVFRLHSEDVQVDTSDRTSVVVKNVTDVEGFRSTGIFASEAGFSSNS